MTRPDGSLLLDERGQTLLLLNHTAQALWELCDGRTTLGEMVAACLELFDVDETQARSDVAAALQELQQAGVLQ